MKRSEYKNFWSSYRDIMTRYEEKVRIARETRERLAREGGRTDEAYDKGWRHSDDAIKAASQIQELELREIGAWPHIPNEYTNNLLYPIEED